MAISDLNLKISPCIHENCSKLKITDTTGVYNATTNTGGWENAATVLAADVTAASIVITTPSNSTITVDVLSAIPDPVTCTFQLSESTLSTPEDGEYKIVYTVTTAGGSKVLTKCIFSACLVRCCIDKMWVKVAQGESTTDCDCGCTEASSLMETALFAESLYKAMIAAAASDMTTERDNLLTKLQRICRLQNCNCN